MSSFKNQVEQIQQNYGDDQFVLFPMGTHISLFGRKADIIARKLDMTVTMRATLSELAFPVLPASTLASLIGEPIIVVPRVPAGAANTLVTKPQTYVEAADLTNTGQSRRRSVHAVVDREWRENLTVRDVQAAATGQATPMFHLGEIWAHLTELNLLPVDGDITTEMAALQLSDPDVPPSGNQDVEMDEAGAMKRKRSESSSPIKASSPRPARKAVKLVVVPEPAAAASSSRATEPTAAASSSSARPAVHPFFGVVKAKGKGKEMAKQKRKGGK